MNQPLPSISETYARHLRTRRLANILGPGPFVLLGLVLLMLPTPSTPGADAPEAKAPEAASTDFAIVGARVFDGERTWPRADVWIEAGRIKEIGESVDLPDGLPTVVGEGKTLLPGFIDAHVHTWGTARADAVRFGVTTLLDQFTQPQVLSAGLDDRRQGGASATADLFSAGVLATAAAGHGTQFGVPVDTVEGPAVAGKWVRARKAEGSDWIKIVIEPGWRSPLATLDPSTVGALIEAAHAEDLLAVVHVSRLDDALTVAQLGADGLVHVWRDRVPTDDEVAIIKDAGLFVIPTLVVIEGMADPSPSLALAETELGRGLSGAQRESLERRFPPMTDLDWQVPLASVRRLQAAGVPILAGSDAPNPTTAMGLSLHRELALLVDAGLTAEAALASATAAPSEHFRVEGRGRISRGMLADLIMVTGDPTREIAATAQLSGVWKRGVPVDLGPVEVAAEDESGPAASDDVATAPEGTLLADFSDGVNSYFGAGWKETTDQRMGGTSVVELAVVEGALRMRGEIRPGSMFPWAGSLVLVGEPPMGAVDFSSRRELRLRVRGDGRRYMAMVFTGPMTGIPPSQPFVAGEEWSTVVLPFSGFQGADFSRLRGISFSAVQEVGEFTFEIDDIELR